MSVLKRVGKKMILGFFPISHAVARVAYAGARNLPPSSRMLPQRILHTFRRLTHPLLKHSPRFATVRLEHFVLRVNLCETIGGNLYYGVPNADDFDRNIMSQLVHEGDVCIDVGANMGLYTLTLSSLVGESGVVHAFEPEPRAFETLSHNVSLNGRTNIVLNQVAVSNESGSATLYDTNESGLAGLGKTSRGSGVGEIAVPLTTIDEYASSKRIPRVDCMKIDVEGYEGHVLRGAQSLLQREKELVVITELDEKNFRELGFPVQDVILYLSDLGYEGWFMNRRAKRLVPLTPESKLEGGVNAVFAPRGSTKHTQLVSILDQ